MEKELIKKATEEFFKYIVHIKKVDWKCAELKYEGINAKFPNLIELLKRG